MQVTINTPIEYSSLIMDVSDWLLCGEVALARVHLHPNPSNDSDMKIGSLLPLAR